MVLAGNAVTVSVVFVIVVVDVVCVRVVNILDGVDVDAGGGGAITIFRGNGEDVVAAFVR